jgi:hypothetical protein
MNKQENVEEWIKRLLEIQQNVQTTQGETRNGWVTYLLGYIESMRDHQQRDKIQ